MSNGQLAEAVRHIMRLAGGCHAKGTPDSQLLQRFIHYHDEGAFETLVRRHGPMVFGVCHRILGNPHDAEDAFQATFLVLVRKASRIGQGHLLGNWLYGVAYRTALKARTIARRSSVFRAAGVSRWCSDDQHEPLSTADPQTELLHREFRALLDEEIARLPKKYRIPIILCYLEGKTNEEAARLLGWPKGTVAGRLSRAREVLRNRLIRRGVTLSAGVMTAYLSQNAASASLPIMLVHATVEAALAANSLAAGVVSASVAALTEGVLKAMLLTKLKIAVAAVLTLGIIGAGTGAVTYQVVAGAKAESDKQEKLLSALPKPFLTQSRVAQSNQNGDQPEQQTHPLTVSGWATDQAGKPVGGATIYLLSINGSRSKIIGITQTNEAGMYTVADAKLPVAVPNGGLRKLPAMGVFRVYGVAEGYGFDYYPARVFVAATEDEAKLEADDRWRPPEFHTLALQYLGEAASLNLKFGPPAALHGRVLDESGQPVKQAKVLLDKVPDLERMVDGLKGTNVKIDAPHSLPALPSSLKEMRTDQDGRFLLKGLPANLTLTVHLEHPSHPALGFKASLPAETAVKPNEQARVLRLDERDGGPITSSRLDIVVPPVRRVIAEVLHADTGQPAKSARIWATRWGSTLEYSYSANTDDNGRVELPLAPGPFTFRVMPPKGNPGLSLADETKRIVAREPAEQNLEFRLPLGGILDLETVEADTGKGVPGIRFLSTIYIDPHGNGETNAEGKFRATCSPGKSTITLPKSSIPAGYEPIEMTRQAVIAAGKTTKLRFLLIKKQQEPAKPEEKDAAKKAEEDRIRTAVNKGLEFLKIRSAKDNAVQYLKSAQRDGNWEHRSEPVPMPYLKGGLTCLAVLGLLDAGVDPKDEVIVKGMDYLRKLPPEGTYVVGLQTMVFARVDPKKDRDLIKRNVDWLLKAVQRDGNGCLHGWSYGQQNPRGGTDNSNTQYAVMGLHEASQAGVKIDQKVWQEIKDYYVRSQSADGGWGYSPMEKVSRRSTMTCAGLCGLIIAGGQLDAKDVVQQDALVKGLKRLGDQFTVKEVMFQYYNLHCLSRTGQLSGQSLFKGSKNQEHDWYRAGAEMLIRTQAADGSWKSSSPLDGNPIIATSFSLMFLAKGK